MIIRKELLERFEEGEKVYVQNTKGSDGKEWNQFPCITLIYVARGSGYFSAGNKNIKTSERDIYIINQDFKFSFYKDETHYMEMYSCLFPVDFLETVWKDSQNDFPVLNNFLTGQEAYLCISDNENFDLRKYMIQMINEYMSGREGCITVIKGYLTILCAEIFRKYNDLEQANEICMGNRLVDEAVMHIRHRIYTAPQPHEIAEKCCVSLEHLGRVFKEHTGMTLTKYINSYRVERVADILKNTDRPIAGLSEKFNCQAEYLRKIFKKYTGMTMNEYRKKYSYHKGQNSSLKYDKRT